MTITSPCCDLFFVFLCGQELSTGVELVWIIYQIPCWYGMGHYNWSFVIRTSYSVQSRSTDVVGCLHKILKIWRIYLVSLWAFLGQIRASSSQKSAVDWITRSDGRIVFWQFGLGGSKILIQYRLLVNPVFLNL